jgi:endonuclease/exonuclease/phosphatase family metal-dependent hydrolase
MANREKARETDPPDPSRGGGVPASFGLCVTLVSAFSTLLMLESSRVFVSYLVFVIDQSHRIELGVTAFGVFAAIGLGGLLGRAIGLRLAVAVCMLGLASSRLVVQFTEQPHARLVCGAIAVVAWGWLLPNLRALSPDDTARGVVLGMLIDLAVRYAFGSVDLPWMPSALRNAATIVVVIAMLCAWPRLLVGKRPAAAGPSGPALLGVGPGLMVFQLLTGNLGILQIRSGLPIQVAVLLSLAGLAAGFAVQIRPTARPSGQPGASAQAVAMTLTLLAELALFAFWRWNGIADVMLVVVSGVTGQLLVFAIRGRGSPGEPPSPTADGLWLTAGMLVQAGLLFAYYSATGQPLLIFAALALLGVGSALSTRRGRAIPEITGGAPIAWLTAAGGALLLAAFLLNRSAWNEVNRQDALPATFTAITYNIQTGFSRDNHWDLEQTARAIEDQRSDVVILQEVSRGWTIAAGVDEARWLSHRLDMNMAWGPSSNDDLWGVAILSRGKIVTAQMYDYTTTENLRRGVLGAAIQTDDGPLYVYATHLDNPTDATQIRLAQTGELLKVTNGKSPAIIGGDFNASPDSDVVTAMLAAGFTDAGGALPPGTGTSAEGNRIDYLFVRGPLAIGLVDVPNVWASDHRPFVARLSLSAGP